jgi:adenylate cyclase, class 2
VRLKLAVLLHARTIREVEIKLRIVDMAALLKKIRRLGAVSHGRVLEENILYDTPDSDFRRRGRLLRLRIETAAPDVSQTSLTRAYDGRRQRAILTSKAPVAVSGTLRYKEKLETETSVADIQSWKQAVKALGLHEGFRYEKYRTSFHLDSTHLDLDETPVGIFLEIEGSPRSIDRIARRLGFLARDYMRYTYWDLYAADCRRRGRKIENMLFEA